MRLFRNRSALLARSELQLTPQGHNCLPRALLQVCGGLGVQQKITQARNGRFGIAFLDINQGQLLLG